VLSQKAKRLMVKRSVSLYFLGLLLFGVCIAIAMSFLKPEKGYPQCADFRTGAVQTSTNSRNLRIGENNPVVGKAYPVGMSAVESRALV
jgi:hypothetical protein